MGSIWFYCSQLLMYVHVRVQTCNPEEEAGKSYEIFFRLLLYQFLANICIYDKNYVIQSSCCKAHYTSGYLSQHETVKL